MNQGPETPYSGETPEKPRWVPYQLSSNAPIVTYSLLGITILVFVLQSISQLAWRVDIPQVIGMKVNTLILQGQYWRFFTPMLLHGGFLHIGFNMYALFIFGPGLERHFGHWRFLALYILSGFAGNVISFIFSPANSLGSSTAIFGLIGAQGIFLYQNRQLFGGMARSALSQLVTIAAINLFIGLSPGIDNWGHAGGLLGGLLFAYLGGPLLKVDGYPPYVSIKDGRENRTVLMAALTVGTFFAILAGISISFRVG